MTRVAVVTGGTRGIGESISLAMKKAGYRVAATYAGNDAAAQKFQAESGIPVYKFDVGDYDQCEKAVAQITRDLGPIDVLVNNAGITRDSALHRMTRAHWGDVIRTNLDSAFNMTRLVIDTMRSRNFGRIISISSINGRKGQFGQANYAAAKAGLVGFSKAIALEGAGTGWSRRGQGHRSGRHDQQHGPHPAGHRPARCAPGHWVPGLVSDVHVAPVGGRPRGRQLPGVGTQRRHP